MANLAGKRLMKDSALVDTCILVYLIDKRESAKHEKAKEWFHSLSEMDRFFVSIQNLREFSNIALKKSTFLPEEINQFVQLFAARFKLLFDGIEDIFTANEISGRKRFWDAMLAATMKRHSINLILTENIKDFKNFKGIEAKNPLEQWV